jgi:hypothetical protein
MVLPVIKEDVEEDGPDEQVIDVGAPPDPDDTSALPPGIEPLVLWHPPPPPSESDAAGTCVQRACALSRRWGRGPRW